MGELTPEEREALRAAIVARGSVTEVVERIIDARLEPVQTVLDRMLRGENVMVIRDLRAALDPAPTTDADGRVERRDGAGGTRWERG